MVELAAQSCQPAAVVAPQPATTTADALAGLSTAFTFGSILLAIVALLGGIAWGYLVKGWAEREAREEAERCTKKWIEEEGFPMLRRQMQEWKETFPPERPISDADVDKLVAALGLDGKDDGSGQK
jgi:hypothetical protein